MILEASVKSETQPQYPSESGTGGSLKGHMRSECAQQFPSIMLASTLLLLELSFMKSRSPGFQILNSPQPSI